MRMAHASDVAVDERPLSSRMRHLAELGVRAANGTPVEQVLDDAIELTRELLGADCTAVLELHEDGQTLSLKAGTGWQLGLVGRFAFTVGRTSSIGYTLLQRDPVVVEDLRRDARFGAVPLLQQHGVVSAASV